MSSVCLNKALQSGPHFGEWNSIGNPIGDVEWMLAIGAICVNCRKDHRRTVYTPTQRTQCRKKPREILCYFILYTKTNSYIWVGRRMCTWCKIGISNTGTFQIEHFAKRSLHNMCSFYYIRDEHILSQAFLYEYNKKYTFYEFIFFKGHILPSLHFKLCTFWEKFK